jgi:hypothetical protein
MGYLQQATTGRNMVTTYFLIFGIPGLVLWAILCAYAGWHSVDDWEQQWERERVNDK